MEKLSLNTITRPLFYKKHVRRGRGSSSCRGAKSGRGSDGQKARSGDNKPKTEGGQYPRVLSFNKRGFNRKKDESIKLVKTSTLDYISRKLNKTNITINDIKQYFNYKENEKIKILFDKKPINCLSSEAHKASKKTLSCIDIRFN